ncbi:hypothetical protein BJP27_24085 (plasmid) [Pseudomonas oryzihabitans]|nr:hypothetical protein BJP27_24085 [Pseudomonas psychrotolerans]
MSTKRKPAKPVTAADANSTTTTGADASAAVVTSAPTSPVEGSGADASAALQAGAPLNGEPNPGGDQPPADQPPNGEIVDQAAALDLQGGEAQGGTDTDTDTDTDADGDGDGDGDEQDDGPAPDSKGQDKDQEQEQHAAQPLTVMLNNHSPSQQVLRPLGVTLESGESLPFTFRDDAHEIACRKHIAELADLHGWGDDEGLHWSAE